MSGKRGGRTGLSASLFAASRKALPYAQVKVNDTPRRVMVDSGCTRTLIHRGWCDTWERRTNAVMWTATDQRWKCLGVTTLVIEPKAGGRAVVEAFVVAKPLCGHMCILGLDAMEQLGGETIHPDRTVTFGAEVRKEVVGSCIDMPAVDECDVRGGAGGLAVDEPDFEAKYDPNQRHWTMKWKWDKETGPEVLRNRREQYRIPEDAKARYDEEVNDWIKQGWLVEYDEAAMGPVKGLIPMMAVIQEAKDKVRPVMDFRELNGYIDAHTREADVCAHKVREWRRYGTKLAMVDLKKAYLQIRVSSELWPYQTVKFNGRHYCLTRLGFGLNVAPLVMKAVLNKVLEQDPKVRAGTSAYVDDIMVNETIVTAEEVGDHLRRFGLESKPPETVDQGMRTLGMRVGQQDGAVMWGRDGELPQRGEGTMTRRELFSWGGKVLGHYPVCGWLRPAVAYLKRRACRDTERWDDEIPDAWVVTGAEEVMDRLEREDPVKGRWDVEGQEATVWVDASALAYGVVLEVNGDVIEDASWLRKDRVTHINMAELDAVIKGINLALTWKMRRLKIMTDSSAVRQWIADGLSGRSRLKTRAANEMLIRRRVEVVVQLVKEYDLDVTIELVPSRRNLADVLTRVPARWMSGEDSCGDSQDQARKKKGKRNVANVSTESPVSVDTEEEGQAAEVVAACNDNGEPSVKDLVRTIHETLGHPGIARTLHLSRRKGIEVTRRMAQTVVKDCEICRAIDPPAEKWDKGHLSVDRVWSRVAMDITHVGPRQFLTMIDCGPSRFAIWRELRSMTAEAVIKQVESVFFERGAPVELLTDNDPAFRSRKFALMAQEWAVRMRFRAAHVPSGNGIVERSHRTIKTIAARSKCSIPEAVYLYNVTPRDDVDPMTAPMNGWGGYVARTKGIEGVETEPEPKCRYSVGDKVWVRKEEARCDDPYEAGEVTRIISSLTVEVNGMPRHIRHLRRRDAEPEECGL